MAIHVAATQGAYRAHTYVLQLKGVRYAQTQFGLIVGGMALAHGSNAGSGETIYGLGFTPQSSTTPFTEFVFSFDTTTPTNVLTRHDLTGILSGDGIRDIDVRPANRQIYGWGFRNIYTIDPATGSATLVSTLNSVQPLDTPTSDFDPVADRLRVVEFSGRNILVNVDTGQGVEQGSMTYASNDGRTGRPVFTSLAYSNNFTGATTTTLYGVDVDNLATIEPESGIVHTVGPLRVPTSSGTGFDISGLTGMAYFVNGSANLYTVNLQTGSATLVGRIGLAANEGVNTITVGVVAAEIAEPGTILLLSVGFPAMAVAFRKRRMSRE